MKQIIQSLRTGETIVADIPSPHASAGQLLIATSASLISAGTERMLLEFAKSSWIERARQQPDKVKMVVDKVRTDGFLTTIDAVRSKLDKPLPLGYCNSGVVVGIGVGVERFAIGDRVASNGWHSEIVVVPANLCAAIPPGVGDDHAAFTPLAAIALQGLRLAAPTLGEVFVVSGLGLVGLLAVQLLRAQGCRVIGADFDLQRLELARSFGAISVDISDPDRLQQVTEIETLGRGVDGVLICVSTDSNEPVRQAAKLSRKRGRIVLVGVTGLELSRADFYEKELSFQVSCSYGPGRYDPSYEQQGNDYPVGFVRWTAQRNFEAVLQLMADGKLDPSALISHSFKHDRATDAYDLLTSKSSSLGILLTYPSLYRQGIGEEARRMHVGAPKQTDTAVVGFIGAGNHAQRALMPAFRAAGARLKSVTSAGGLNASHAAAKFGFESASTAVDDVFSDSEINVVVVATRHGTHAEFASRALREGKHVYVEKPLALTRGQLSMLRNAWTESRDLPSPPLLMAGFNRRFAPHIRKIKALLESVSGPKVFVLTVNAGTVPGDHWTLDLKDGGGRILGEACHFIDLLRFLAASPFSEVGLTVLGGSFPRDSSAIRLAFADGSIGTLHYLTNGHRSFPKERLEIFTGGRILQLTNFRTLSGFGWRGFSRMNLWRQDKGAMPCAAAFVNAVRAGGPAPIPPEELFETAEVSIDLAERANGTDASGTNGP